jgi:AraC-like DNA-binding protein
MLVRARPHPRLTGRVIAYEGYRVQGDRRLRRHLVPMASVAMVLDLTSPTRTAPVAKVGSAAGIISPVTGLHDGPLGFFQQGRDNGIIVGLTPAGAYSLFGLPMHHLARASVNLVDLLGPRAERLIDLLAGTVTWSERFAVLDSCLSAWISAGPPASEAMDHGWRLLVRSSGQLAIGDLAGELGFSRRHLTALAREQIGLPLKSVARIMRFQRALHLLKTAQRPAPSAIATRCGYVDQAHLNHDFRALADRTPIQLLSACRRGLRSPRSPAAGCLDSARSTGRVAAQ